MVYTDYEILHKIISELSLNFIVYEFYETNYVFKTRWYVILKTCLGTYLMISSVFELDLIIINQCFIIISEIIIVIICVWEEYYFCLDI